MCIVDLLLVVRVIYVRGFLAELMGKSATTSFFEINELLVLYLKTYTLSLYLDHIVLNFHLISLLIVGSDRVHHFVHKLR